jgi:hypothetical protein
MKMPFVGLAGLASGFAVFSGCANGDFTSSSGQQVLAALNGCDVDLPSGQFMNAGTLGPVISAGLLPVSLIDDKVRRILRGVISYGYLDRQQLLPSIPLDNFNSEYVALQIAREGVVLVVLHGGGNFDSSGWIDQVGAYLHTFYPGQNGGQALAEILVGKVNPSGKLPVTFERRITDNPAYATFPKPVNQHPNEIAYSEGLYVGYRGYEKRKTKPVNVSFTVTNTGKRAGAEVAQLYVGQENSTVDRPIKELKGFKKVYLQPGQSKQ